MAVIAYGAICDVSKNSYDKGQRDAIEGRLHWQKLIDRNGKAHWVELTPPGR